VWGSRSKEEPVPTYQYACTACDERLEVVQKFTDDPLTECPVCGGRLRKVFSAAGIIFKGSGFYRTDSRAPAKSSSSSNGADKKDEPAKSSDSTSDSSKASDKGSDSAKKTTDSKSGSSSSSSSSSEKVA
jgi:putative FmdB family regulatory protein